MEATRTIKGLYPLRPLRRKVSQATLDHWRRYGKGPLFMKIGGHVLYRLSDIEAYEESVVRQETRKDPGKVILYPSGDIGRE